MLWASILLITFILFLGDMAFLKKIYIKFCLISVFDTGCHYGDLADLELTI